MIKLGFLFRLYFDPLIAIVAAVLIYLFLGIYIPEHFYGELLFSALADKAQYWAPRLFFLVICIAVVWAIHRTWLLIQAQQGKGQFCDICGGPVILKNGRYSGYYHCLTCWKNRSW